MTSPPESGRRVGGRYDLREEVGAGGFAVVYRARDTDTGQTVAVKFPNYEGSSNDREVIDRYFGIEADTLTRIREAGGHPNVMTLHERGSEDGTPYLVVEYVDGYELDAAIDETGPLGEDLAEQVRAVGIDLCEAMSFLHRNEIVYRDLKPDNVMLTERDGRPTPVVIDFNTATGFDAAGAASDSDTTILGPYKPPEVADAGGTDARQGPWSDVYSIGKMLLFLLKGTVPRKDGINPREFGVACEPYLADIVETATRSNYEDRYRNATAMKRALVARDASRPRRARLTYLQTGDQFTVYPGDTVGRRDAVGPSPAIAIEDEDEYVSTIQVQFDIEEGKQPDAAGKPPESRAWVLQDRSLNGTYVQTGDGWQRVLCADGRERLRERGEDPTDRHGDVPPTTYPLASGDLVALVHPSYGVTFRFEEA